MHGMMHRDACRMQLLGIFRYACRNANDFIHFDEASHFGESVMHEVVHVGMQFGNCIFCRTLFLFMMRDC